MSTEEIKNEEFQGKLLLAENQNNVVFSESCFADI